MKKLKNDFTPQKPYGAYRIHPVLCEWKAYLTYEVMRYMVNPVLCDWSLKADFHSPISGAREDT